MLPESSKKALRQPDEIVGFFEKRLYQFENRKKHIFSGLIILLVIVGISFFVQAILSGKNQKAAHEFSKVMEKLPSNLSQETGDWKSFLDEDNKFIAQYKRSSILPIAYFFKAKAEYSLKQYPEALASYQTASKKMRPPYQYLALEGEAISHMELQHWDQALTVWQSLSTKKDNPLRDFHLYNLALVQEQLGNSDQAQQTYKTLQQDFPESSYIETAKLKLLSTSAK